MLRDFKTDFGRIKSQLLKALDIIAVLKPVCVKCNGLNYLNDVFILKLKFFNGKMNA